MIDGFASQAHSESLPYYQWKSTDNRIEKIVATDTVDNIFNVLKKAVEYILLHTFVKREQAATFNSLKSSSDGISMVLQVDSEFVEFAKPLSLLRPNQHLVKILR